MSEPTERALVTTDMWDRLAAAWDARGAWHAEITAGLTRTMVDAVDPAPGQDIVEAACGPTADLAREVARRCPSCRIRATDLSPAMLDAARRRGGDALDYGILDVADPDLADDTLDALVARWVYMLLPDPGAAFAQARRVLRTGGRLVAAVFDSAATNQFFMLPASVLIERGRLAPPRPGEPSMFALADADRTTALLEGAGFAEVRHEAVDLAYTFADRDELWSVVTGFTGPVSLALAQVDATEATEIRRAIEDRAARFAAGPGYVLPGRALVFTAA